MFVIKGDSWDSDRDDCRSEKSDVVRNGHQGYANVGFRVVRDESPSTTDITTVASARTPVDAIYDLQGRRLLHQKHGINIVGGKKLFVTSKAK